MERVILNDDDVVSVNQEDTFVEGSTFTVAEAMREIEEMLENCKSSNVPRKEWVSTRVGCRCMMEGHKWMEGKVRITLEFTPDTKNSDFPSSEIE